MLKKEAFNLAMNDGYTFEGDSISMGAAMIDFEAQTGTIVKIPLNTMNRHGLIAGATGTGKTKTLQIIAEELSKKGVPSLIMDIKGDLSGIAAASAGHPKIDERHNKIGFSFEAGSSPIEFLSLSDEKGVKLRATVSEFGPVLFSKILGLNDTQSGVVSVVFKFCDDNGLPLLDLQDFKKVINYISKEGKDEIEGEYGLVSSASVGAILRKTLEIERQGADVFFGEPSFEVEDLMRTDNGFGIVSILRLTDIQNKPKLFSTFMLCLIAELYAKLPEEGDMDKPKLCVFIDEAHLIFDEASDALLDQLETTIKLIRSKGVGLYFITQNPMDVPEAILSQLGLKVQHALRAFTAKDRKAIKLTAENYPLTEFYDTKDMLTHLGTGECFISALGKKGRPTPLVHTLLRAPQSRMDVLMDAEIDNLVSASKLVKRYNKEVDRESAYEILTAKLDKAAKQEVERKPVVEKALQSSRRTRQQKSTLEQILGSTAARQIGRTIARELTRGLMGILGIKR